MSHGGGMPAGPGGQGGDPAEPVPPATDEDAYSSDEEDEVAARLEALGYLD
jgi:hypothetical protein